MELPAVLVRCSKSRDILLHPERRGLSRYTETALCGFPSVIDQSRRKVRPISAGVPCSEGPPQRRLSP